MAISEKDKRLFLEEQTGPREFLVYCGTHGYFGNIDKAPTLGCSKCMQTYILQRYLEVPPSRRREFLEDFTAMVRYSIEAVAKGTFEVNLFEHPQVSIEHDVPDPEIKKVKD